MIHELRTYTLIPGTQASYIPLFEDAWKRIRGDRHGKLEGYWSTDSGTLNQVVHLWSFNDLVERQRLRAELAKNEAWTGEYLAKSQPFLISQENKIMSPILPLAPPHETGHIYELRTYRTIPGKTREWLDRFVAVQPVREKYSKRVGLWQTEIAQLNEVAHMWVYRDATERAAVRARLMQDSDFRQFLSAATPLLVHMQSIILSPTSLSPMK